MPLIPDDINEIFDAVISGHDRFFNVSRYGAVGNGTTDDTSAVSSALAAAKAAGGGTVYFPPGTYRVRQTLLIDFSDLTIRGDHAEIFFDPGAPIVSGQNDRLFFVHAGDSGGFSDERDIVGSIAVGVAAFTADDIADVADLEEGDWLLVAEMDADVPPQNEIVLFDWVRVSSVVGDQVNVYAPFRTAFPGTHATVKFRRVTNLVQNTVIRDLRIRSTDAVNSLVHVCVAVSRETHIKNIVSTSAKGNCFYSYRAAEVHVSDCHQRSNFSQASEFAATVGLSITGCTFSTYEAQSTGAQLTLDFGTAFFRVSGNLIGPAGDIACMLLYGVHDGTFEGNIIDYVRVEGLADALGLLLQGASRVVVRGNVLRGGEGGAAKGIVAADTSGLVVDFTSTGNLIIDNVVENFAEPYGTKLDTDCYRSIAANATTMWGRTEAMSTYDPGAANTSQLRIAESPNYRLNIGYDENTINAGLTAAIFDNSFAHDDSLMSFRFGNTQKMGLRGDGRLTLNGYLSVSNTAAVLRSGTGTPEGAVTAPVGSLYMRTDGGGSTSLYVKESGTGNTGWVAK